MPYSLDPNRYPEVFRTLFAKGYEGRFELPLDSEGEAVNLVHRLNAYRRALEHHVYPGWAEAAKVSVKSEGTTVILENKSRKLEAKLRAMGVEIEQTPEGIKATDHIDEYLSEVDIFNKHLKESQDDKE